MSWLDIFIFLVVVSAVVRGLGLGLVRQLCSAGGFIGGIFAGIWLQDRLLSSSQDVVAAVGIIIGCSFVLLALGEYIGTKVHNQLAHFHLGSVDEIFGGIVGAGAVLVAVWLGANIAGNLPGSPWQQTIQKSQIIKSLNQLLPPAPSVIKEISSLIKPNSFPQVFNQQEPKPSQQVQIPDLGEFTSVTRAAAPSVVKIEGEGCGGIVEGSGFVASDGLVITNAHVVAGVAKPKVLDGNGSHSAQVVWFNPDLDFAALRATHLAGKPLAFDTDPAQQGTPGVVLGYPGGGAFQADPAAILDRFLAVGHNIYDQGSVNREVYSADVDVINGNSGGPLIDKDGEVIGVVFARSTQYEHVGYALTAAQVASDFTRAQQSTTATSTGSCTQQ